MKGWLLKKEVRKYDVDSGNRQKRKVFDIGFLIIPCLFLLHTLFVSPLYEFPLNDDWSYALLVRNFYEKGVFKIIDWVAPSSVFHIFWGWLFVIPFGFSFSMLRISTILLHLMGSLALYKLFKEIGFSIAWRLFSVLIIVYNPWIFQLSYSFMTDVPYLSFLMIGLLFYYKGIFGKKDVFLWVGSIASSISFLIREMGILLPVSVCIYFLLCEMGSLKKRIIAIIGIPLTTVIFYEYWYLFIHGVTEAHMIYRHTMMRNLITMHIGSQFFGRSFSLLYFLGLVLLPLSTLVFFSLPQKILCLTLTKRIYLGGLLLLILGIAIKRAAYTPIDSLWTSASFLGVMQGHKPPVISGNGGEILFWISVISSCVLFSWFYIGIVEKGFARRKALVFFLLLGFLQFCYLLIVPFFWQRYFVPFIPFVTLTTSLCIKNGSLMRSPFICSFLIIPALFSVFSTKDSLSWNQTKWSTAQGLVKKGIPVNYIEAGVEWDCWNFYEYSKDHPDKKPKRYYSVPWWLIDPTPAIDPIYTLSFSELEGYELLSKQGYDSPFYRTHQEILVLVKKPPKTIEGFEDPKKDFTTGWNHNLQSNTLLFDQNADFVSEGTSSLKCELKTNSKDTFHYGGVRVKTSMNVIGFIFDIWVVNPEDIKKIFIYCYDDKGNFTAKWSRDVIVAPILGGGKNTFFFLFGLSQDSFQFGGGSGGKTDYVDIFVESDKEDAKIIFYIDNFRA